MKIILLSGGKSTRFDPLTNKNNYKFVGQTSIELRINQVRKYYPDSQFILVVENLKDFPQNYQNLQVVEQHGAGQHGAVLSAIKNITEEDSVLIINVNDFFEDSLFELFSATNKSSNLLTAFQTKSYFPGGYLDIDSNGLVKKIVEKPGEGNEPSNYVRLVFDYFSSIRVLRESLESATSNSDDLYEVAIQNMIDSGQEFQIIDYKGLWKSIKYPWHVLDVMDVFLNRVVETKIHKSVSIAKSAVINGNVIIDEGSKIMDGAVINGPVYIGKNVVVANHTLVRSSMIGDDCVIGFGSEVAKSYLGPKTILHNNYLGDSVVEGDSSFGAGTITGNYRFDGKSIRVNIKGEKVDSRRGKLGAFIGKNVRTGIGVLLMPGVKLGANSVVGAGAIITDDIPSNSFVKNVSNLDIRENNYND